MGSARNGVRVGLSLVGAVLTCLACWVPAVARAAAPSVKTVVVHVLDGESATVIGTVERGGLLTDVSADYGPVGGQWCTADGREGTPTETPLAGLEEQEGVPSEARVPLKGLEPETWYCAELVAHNEEGVAYGGLVDFKTLEKGTAREPEELPLPPKYLEPYKEPNAGGAAFDERFSRESLQQLERERAAVQAHEREAREASELQHGLALRCVVPYLKGRSLAAARRALAAAHCALGSVRDFSTHHGVIVVAQTVPAGRTLPADTAVGVKLGRLTEGAKKHTRRRDPTPTSRSFW